MPALSFAGEGRGGLCGKRAAGECAGRRAAFGGALFNISLPRGSVLCDTAPCMAQKALKHASTGPSGKKAAYATPALEKGLDILELLARERHGLTKSEIARALRRTVSEIFRMLICLRDRGYIVEAERDSYVLSLRLFQLAQEHPPTERLLAEALPRMTLLAEALHQSCHLGVLEGGRVVILVQANAPVPVGLYVKAGTAVDLMEASTGRVILAHLPEEQQQTVLAEWRRETGRGLPGGLAAQLEGIRRRGYEKHASYQVKGVTNLSVPILGENGRAVAALTVPFIQRLRPPASVDEAKDLLAKACREISGAVGARLPLAAG